MMFGILKKTATLSLVVSLFACSEKFESVDYDPGYKDEHEYETTYERVPVLLAMNNPFYTTISRGAGAITPEDSWVKQELTYYVYSFLTNNYVYNGPIDYTQKFNPESDENPDKPIQCLMDDPKTGRGVAFKLLDNEMLDQVDKDTEYFYSQSNQYCKYNFFAYAIDDADVRKVIRNKDNVQLDIEIDGTQDVITAVGKPIEEQIGNINPENDKLLYSNVINGELVFSTATGHRGMFPKLDGKHCLSLFKFNIVGEDALCDKIYVEEIYVMANKQWRFTVAADDQTKLGLSLPEGKSEKLEKVILQEMTEEGNPASVKPLAKGKYNVEQGETRYDLGMGLLLPPRDSYDLYVRCRYPSLNSEGKQVNRYYTARYNLAHRTLGDNAIMKTEPFEAGAQYDVTMHIYGYQPIQMSIGGLAWSEPIEIILDEDDITNYE